MKRILIADDAHFMRTTLKLMLEKNGYEVIGEAKDGVEAVSLYKALSPDIVTLDITMPNLTGLDALKAIKKLNPNATVIMITAMGQESMVKEAIVSGAKSFIVKPFKEDHLLKVLSQL